MTETIVVHPASAKGERTLPVDISEMWMSVLQYQRNDIVTIITMNNTNLSKTVSYRGLINMYW